MTHTSRSPGYAPALRRKAAKPICAFALALIFCFCFAGCAVGSGGERGTTEASEEVPAGIAVTGADGYSLLVRSENATEMTLSSFSTVFRALASHDAGITASDDFDLKRPSEEEREKILSRREILIGSTNRQESSATLEGLAPRDWTIAISGTKLVIAGGSEWALRDACEAFAAGLSEKEGIMYYSGPGEGRTDTSYRIITTDQKTSRVEVYVIPDCGRIGDAVWSMTYSEYNIADARARLYEGRTVILAAYGASSASIVDYETKKTVWRTGYAADNPHACELIPCGGGYAVGVASSSGNEVRFFRIDDSVEFTPVSFEDAHGLLWDPELGGVWCLGGSELSLFDVELTDSGIAVTEREGYRKKLPTLYGHELQPMPGDTDSLILSTGSSVYVYSKSTGVFSGGEGASALPGSSRRENVKGIGLFPDGSAILSVPDGAFKSWTTASLIFIAGGKYTLTLNIAGSGFYKARPFSTDYN